MFTGMDTTPRQPVKIRFRQGPSQRPVAPAQDAPGLVRIGHAERQLHPGHPLVVVEPRNQVVKLVPSRKAAREARMAMAGERPAIPVPAPGMVLDERYRLEAEIGRGGVCNIFRATDRLLDMEVAIKVLRPEACADPDFIRTLFDEARLALRLSHPQIVRLHTLEGGDGFYYLVMERLEGETLRRCLADYGRLPLRSVADIAEACFPPLLHAHKRGVLHNDLKPDNFLLTDDGTLKLIDFGLASLASGAGDDHSRACLGTPAYMSPERLRRAPLDERSDIYSLGLTLYELCAGQLPFPDNLTPAELLALPGLSLDGVGDRVRAVLERAVARDPGARWATLDQFIPAFLEAVAADPE